MNGWQTNPLMDRMVVEALSRSPSLCVSLSLPLSIYLSIHPSIHRLIDRSIDWSIDLSIYRSIDLSIYLSMYVSIYLSIDRSIYLYAQSPWFARIATLRIPCRRTWEEKLQIVLRIRRVFCFRSQSFQGFRVLGFWVRRLVSTKTLATRRFLSMSKDYILNSILTLRANHRVLPYL